MYTKIIFIIFFFNINTQEEIFDSGDICREHQEKIKNFNLEEFKSAFNDNDLKYKINNVNFSNIDNLQSKLNFVTNKFKVEKERSFIVKYNKELIDSRINFLKYGKKVNIKKLNKVNSLIQKSIEYIKNLFVIYTNPLDLVIDLNLKNFSQKLMDITNLIPKFKTIKEKDLDFYLFIYLDYDESTSILGRSDPEISKTFFGSRPVIGYINLNIYGLNETDSESDIKYNEIMTVIHEIFHSFFLVHKDTMANIMNKLKKSDDNIKNYLKKYNDFYNLYTFLENSSNLNLLFDDDTHHFNSNFFYNDIMHSEDNIINDFTFISVGLFEIMTYNTIRIKKKLLRNNYDSCLPIIKELIFNNNCSNKEKNFIKGFNNRGIIKINNKCEEKDKHFCNFTYQHKNYCEENKKCYDPKNHRDSNCYDDTNNKVYEKTLFNENFGKNSNCFILNSNSKIYPQCFENKIDFYNKKIFVSIENNEFTCDYVQSHSNKIIDIKINDKDLKLECPDYNRFYLNNLSKLCPDDCNLNGRCIDLNKCECFEGYDPETNCEVRIGVVINIKTNNIRLPKTVDCKIPSIKNIFKTNYIFPKKLSLEQEKLLKSKGVDQYAICLRNTYILVNINHSKTRRLFNYFK